MGKATGFVASRRDCKDREIEIWHVQDSAQQVQAVRFPDLQRAPILQSPTKARSQITTTIFKVFQSRVWSLDFPSFRCSERLSPSNLLVFSFCLFWSALIFCLGTRQSQKNPVAWESACMIQIPCLQMPCHSSPVFFLWNLVEPLLPKRLESTMPSLFLQCLHSAG